MLCQTVSPSCDLWFLICLIIFVNVQLSYIPSLVQTVLVIPEIMGCFDIYGSRCSDLLEHVYGNSGPPTKDKLVAERQNHSGF